MTPLTAEEQGKLLQWARRAIATGTEVNRAELTPNLWAMRAVFVTLMKHGELRGCIGKMNFDAPIWQNTVAAARAAAFEDPRFPSLAEEELAECRLEVSILDPPCVIGGIEEFDVLRHGIIVAQGAHSALLLPKVAREYNWDTETTLAMVCRKAGLVSTAWQEAKTQLKVFEAFEFAE